MAMSPNAKRANRTRFTDYQIKVLQEFFENNAYPKDDDLEYLSKLLSLSPRVIVVWFQNARQKARKIYENQPSLDPDDEGAGRFTRTPGLNYQCKKCLLVFQRYYELIRHQKQHCFKEEDAKRSAQAQKAAAHAAASFVGQTGPARSEPSQSPGILEQAMVSPLSDIRRSCDSDENKANQVPLVPIPFHRLLEEKKTFGTMFEKFSQEERVIKFINDASHQMASGPGAFPVTGPFAMLQKQAAESAKFDPQDSDDQSMDSFISSPTSKRKMSDDTEECVIERDENGQPKDKRLRTTILPEQLDYLYQKYQLESNPSRKMLEQIAAEVGLRKRVVQVWFQNTRARERKGQFRAHQQVINKRCPFCPALFKVRSALESHLATKHASQYTRGDINIDSLPDAGGGEDCPVGSLGGGGGRSTLFPSIPCPASPPPGQMPPLIPNNDNSSDFEANMRKYYEDTMKQFISDVSLGKQGMSERSFKPERSNEALDLSSPPLKHNNRSDEMPEREEGRKLGQAASPGMPDGQVYDFEEDRGGASDNGVEGYHVDLSGAGHLGQQGFDIKKRYRTQMSTVQVKLMKHVFELHKTPSMSECLALAQLIGLQKRVVQVWFQNARAKEKKARLNLQQITGKDAESAETPVECKFCSRQYQNKFGIQEHIFDREHLDNVRKAIEAGNYEPETPGYSLNQKASALYKANNSSEEMEQRARTKEESPPPLVPSEEVPSYRAPRAPQYDPEGPQQQQQYRPEQQPAPPASYTEFPAGPPAAYPPASAAYPRQQYDQYSGYIGSYHGRAFYF
jgi:AT-binding transcription factor 1